MKTAGIYISLIAGLLLFSAASYAGDGNELLQQCTQAERLMDGETTDDEFGAGLWLGTIAGVQMTLKIVRTNGGDDAAINTYIPSGVNNGQGVRVVLAYLRANPAMLHELDMALIILALNAAFPCDSSDS
jgi:hypothetical protein